MSHLIAVGLSHRTAPIAVREQAAIPAQELPAVLQRLCAQPPLREAAILSTCNRVEIYAVSDDAGTAQACAAEALTGRQAGSAQALRGSLYRLQDQDAVRHLFRVAAGMESMILGESEIAAQVKHAYLTAQACGATGPLLNRVFQKALHNSKLVRSRTSLAEGQVSIGSVIVSLAKARFGGDLSGCEVLLWGAGKAAEATTRHFASSGIAGLWIVNRTQAKAEDLASLCQGRCLSWEQALHHLAHVDIAIVCTQAPHYVIDRDDVNAILPQRRDRPLFLIDLSVPRNVDPALKGRPGLELLNVDDLQAAAAPARIARERELARGEAQVESQVTHFIRWWTSTVNTEAGACQLIGAVS